MKRERTFNSYGELAAFYNVMVLEGTPIEAPFIDAMQIWGEERAAQEEKIKQLEARESGWISVKDRLPEKTQYVLVASNMAKGAFYALFNFSRTGDHWFSQEGTDDPYYHITHWMPLPTAPVK